MGSGETLRDLSSGQYVLFLLLTVALRVTVLYVVCPLAFYLGPLGAVFEVKKKVP